MSKREIMRAIDERLQRGNQASPVGDTSFARQVRCLLTWPVFQHAYDGIFIPRSDKPRKYYEHCVCCEKARSWVALRTNFEQPGKVISQENGKHVGHLRRERARSKA